MTTKTNNSLNNSNSQNLGNLPIWDLSDLYESTGCKEISSDLKFVEKKVIEFEENYETWI